MESHKNLLRDSGSPMRRQQRGVEPPSLYLQPSTSSQKNYQSRESLLFHAVPGFDRSALAGHLSSAQLSAQDPASTMRKLKEQERELRSEIASLSSLRTRSRSSERPPLAHREQSSPTSLSRSPSTGVMDIGGLVWTSGSDQQVYRWSPPLSKRHLYRKLDSLGTID